MVQRFGIDRRRARRHHLLGLMILNGIVFVGVGFLLLKTSDDPVRATLFWTANPVLIQQLVAAVISTRSWRRRQSARSRWRVASRVSRATY